MFTELLSPNIGYRGHFTSTTSYSIQLKGNWEDIKHEISCSNVIQRDNLLFAKKLDKNLIPIAKEGDKDVDINKV